MRTLAIIFLLLAGTVTSHAAHAQNSGVYDPNNGIQITEPSGPIPKGANPKVPLPVPVTVPSGTQFPVTTPATTYQGTMTLAAATSTTLITANVTISAGSIPAAGAFARLFALNTGMNPTYVCWLANTCSATSGGELLAAGASDTKNITGSAAVPSFYSPLGTTLSISN